MNDVEAVKSKGEIEAIEMLLKKHHGQLYADIWRIGLNLSLRISDLVQIRFEDLNIKNRSYICIEGKTGKKRHLRLNSIVLEIVGRRRRKYPEDKYLFQPHANRCGKNVNPIHRASVSRAFKDVGDILGLRINTHSMRKTRGWVMWNDGVPIEKIARVLNHSAPSVTMHYLGITRSEVLDTYDAYLL